MASHATPLPNDHDDAHSRIEAWTVEQAADVLSAASISTPRPARNRNVTLDIPLDDSPSDLLKPASPPTRRPEPSHTVYKRREPIRRDSQNRRNALLKGKEGSRRRQRWENDRLLSNPHAEPPLPSDWEVRPTHSAQAVPYFLAPLWDTEFARRAAARNAAAVERAQPASKEEAAAQKVARDLKAKLKRAQGAKGLLQDLEREVRGFVEQWEAKQRQLESEGLIEETDSEDEEIVFVGRNGAMSDEKRREREDGTLRKDKLIFQSLIDDHGASFGWVFLGCGCECCLLTVCQTLPRTCYRYLLRTQDMVCYDRWAKGGVCWSQGRPDNKEAQPYQERVAHASLGSRLDFELFCLDYDTSIGLSLVRRHCSPPQQ